MCVSFMRLKASSKLWNCKGRILTVTHTLLFALLYFCSCFDWVASQPLADCKNSINIYCYEGSFAKSKNGRNPKKSAKSCAQVRWTANLRYLLLFILTFATIISEKSKQQSEWAIANNAKIIAVVYYKQPQHTLPDNYLCTWSDASDAIANANLQRP